MTRKIAVTLLVATLAGCGGGGSSATDTGDGTSPPPPPPPPPNPEGFYTGSVTVAGVTIDLLALVDTNGDARVYEYAPPGSMAPQVASLGPGEVFDPSPQQITPDGSGKFSVDVTAYPTNLSGSITGTVNQGQDITGTVVSGVITQAFTISYDAQSNQAASFPAIAGSYSFSIAVGSTAHAMTISIDGTTGAIAGSDDAGCNYSGTTSIPNAAENIYEISFQVANPACGLSGSLNGLAAAHLSQVNNNPLLVVDGTLTVSSASQRVGVGTELVPVPP